MDFKEITERQMETERFLLQSFRERLEACPPGYLNCKSDSHGRLRYYHILPGDPKSYYLNRQMTPLIHELKYKRLLQEIIKRLEQNLKAREKYLKAYAPFDYASICKQLPKAYQNADIPYEDADLWTTLQGTSQQTLQPDGTPHFTQSENPYHRDQLIHKTTFGLLTRTKAEASVAELLYGSGLSFHYEKKLMLQDENGTPKIRYPDFTIPIAPWLDYYMEYDGMYQDETYRKRHEETLRLYHLNGIYPPKNLIILMEGPDGAFHADSILQTIEGVLVPLCTRYSSSRHISATSQNPRSRP
ncbi:MAG: hypothetical protein ACI4WY_00605 [Anaerovoracaceae bacterium]